MHRAVETYGAADAILSLSTTRVDNISLEEDISLANSERKHNSINTHICVMNSNENEIVLFVGRE